MRLHGRRSEPRAAREKRWFINHVVVHKNQIAFFREEHRGYRVVCSRSPILAAARGFDTGSELVEKAGTSMGTLFSLRERQEWQSAPRVGT